MAMISEEGNEDSLMVVLNVFIVGVVSSSAPLSLLSLPCLDPSIPPLL